MTETEAIDLAARISQTWRSGPPASVWEEELVELDAGQAGTAFVRLRRTSTRAVSVAEFYDTYRAVKPTDASTPRVECPRCDTSGWLYVDPLIVKHGERDIEYSQVRPCGCTIGQQMAQSPVWTKRKIAQ